MRKILSFVLIFMMSAIFALSYAADYESYDFHYNKHITVEDGVDAEVVGDELEVVYEAVYEDVYNKIDAEFDDFEIILDKAQIHVWLEGGTEPSMTFEEFIENKVHDNGNKYGILKQMESTEDAEIKEDNDKGKGKNSKSNGKGKGKANASRRGNGRNPRNRANGFRRFWSDMEDSIDEITNPAGNPMPGKFHYQYDAEDILASNLELVEEEFKLIARDLDEIFEDFFNGYKTSEEVIDGGEEVVNMAIHLEFMIMVHEEEIDFEMVEGLDVEVYEDDESKGKVSGWVGDQAFNEKRPWVVYFIYPED